MSSSKSTKSTKNTKSTKHAKSTRSKSSHRRRRLKCDTGQELTFTCDKQLYRFVTAHCAKNERCVGDPCVICKHAEEQLLSYAALTVTPLSMVDVSLKKMPCLTCARLLLGSGLKRLTILTAPQDDAEEIVYELLATCIALCFPEMDEKRPKHKGAGYQSTTARKTPRIASQCVSADSARGGTHAKTRRER